MEIVITSPSSTTKYTFISLTSLNDGLAFFSLNATTVWVNRFSCWFYFFLSREKGFWLDGHSSWVWWMLENRGKKRQVVVEGRWDEGKIYIAKKHWWKREENDDYNTTTTLCEIWTMLKENVKEKIKRMKYFLCPSTFIFFPRINNGHF